MTDASNQIRVTVAPGAGRIARREAALLFDPSGDNAELVASFDAALTDVEAITAVKQHLIDAEFQSAPVVVIDWRTSGLGLVVFGDVAVRSSTLAAPMISGAGSGTWIERQLGDLEFGDATEAQVWCGDEADDATDLRLGIVRGGGVQVLFVRDAEPPGAEIPPPEPEHRNPRPPALIAESEPAVLAAKPATDLSATTPLLTTTPASTPDWPFAPVPAMASTSNGNGTNGVTGGATPDRAVEPGFVAKPNRLMPVDTDRAAVPSGSVATAADPFTDSAHNSFEDHVTEPAGSIDGLDEIRGVTTGLVEALLCANGHSNPPQHLICRLCAVEIDPDSVVDLIAQPSVGHLRFADGTVVEVDGPRVIGRKPVSTDGACHPVVIDHAEVSRTHVQLAVEGWAVLVTDLGSRNGTWVIPPSDPTPIKLGADVPYLLEHGTTVHLGGPEASFTYD